jgi:hypothetical protein
MEGGRGIFGSEGDDFGVTFFGNRIAILISGGNVRIAILIWAA